MNMQRIQTKTMLLTRTTTSCDAHSHPEFEAEYESTCALREDIDWLLSFLETTVAKGVKYSPGQFIQIGWMRDRVSAQGDNLTLFEPDFTEAPVRFVRGVTNTLRQLRLQKSVAESVGLETKMLFPNIRQSGIVCSRHQDSIDFVMERVEPKNHDSGWFVGCDDPTHNHNDPANLQRLSLYELAVAKPDCIAFLALPEHCFVKRLTGTTEIRYNQEVLEIKTNSYLAQRANSRFI